MKTFGEKVTSVALRRARTARAARMTSSRDASARACAAVRLMRSPGQADGGRPAEDGAVADRRPQLELRGPGLLVDRGDGARADEALAGEDVAEEPGAERLHGLRPAR